MADDGNVVPFRPKPKSAPVLPPAEAGLSRRVQRAQPGARALAAEQAKGPRERYGKAAARQASERLIATGRVVPARITLALDLAGLEGPEVDTACGAAEPDVDMWELGLAVPTLEQVNLLAGLTGMSAAYFYTPIEPGPLLGGTVFICGRGGCETPEPNVVDANGVLLYGGKPREMPDAQRALF